MRLAFLPVLLGCVAAMSFTSLGAAAGETSTGGKPACRKAEVNPVTGNVLCIDPLGAEVAPAPAAEPCKTAAQGDAEWTFRPSCKDGGGAPAKQPGAQG